MWKKVLITIFSSPDSYQEIQATLTEMESCMKLLSPEFDLTDVQSRVQSCPAARECLSADEQPCCSKDLLDDRKETMKREKQEEGTSTEGKGAKDEPKTEQDAKRRHNKEPAGKKAEEEEEDEEEGHSEVVDDSFKRSFGLISHSYSLDLNISRGKFTSTNT